MTGITGLVNPLTFIAEMSQNMMLRFDPDGSIWAKISAPRKPGDKSPGTVYINGILYSTASPTFVKIFN